MKTRWNPTLKTSLEQPPNRLFIDFLTRCCCICTPHRLSQNLKACQKACSSMLIFLDPVIFIYHKKRRLILLHPGYVLESFSFVLVFAVLWLLCQKFSPQMTKLFGNTLQAPEVSCEVKVLEFYFSYSLLTSLPFHHHQ